MNQIDTTYLNKCNLALERAYSRLDNYQTSDIEYEIYRSVIIKEFEIINSTAHDYGEFLANETLVLMKQFIVDSRRLIEVIDAH